MSEKTISKGNTFFSSDAWEKLKTALNLSNEINQLTMIVFILINNCLVCFNTNKTKSFCLFQVLKQLSVLCIY